MLVITRAYHNQNLLFDTKDSAKDTAQFLWFIIIYPLVN